MDRIVTLVGYSSPVCPGSHDSISLLFLISHITLIYLLHCLANIGIIKILCCISLVART